MNDSFKKQVFVVGDEKKEIRIKLKINNLFDELSRRNKGIGKTINNYMKNLDLNKLNSLIQSSESQRVKSRNSNFRKSELQASLLPSKIITKSKYPQKSFQITNLSSSVHSSQRKSNNKQNYNIPQVNMSYKNISHLKSKYKEINNESISNSEKLLAEIEELKSKEGKNSFEMIPKVTGYKCYTSNLIRSSNKDLELHELASQTLRWNSRISTLPPVTSKIAKPILKERKFDNRNNDGYQSYSIRMQFQKQFDHYSHKLRYNMSKLCLISSLPSIKIQSIKAKTSNFEKASSRLQSLNVEF